VLLTAIGDIDPRHARVFTRAGRSDEARAFRAASRHSRRVRILRVAIPVTVVTGLVGGVLATSLLKPLRMLSKLPVDIGSVVVSGSKIMMQQPRIAGFTKDNRRYHLTAQAAGQDLSKPDLIELQGIQATVETEDNGRFQTTARSGLYNTKTELLTLKDNIVVTSSNGSRALLSEAVLDVKASRIVSEQSVEVTTSTMTIDSNRLEVVEGGDIMRFERGVTVVIVPENSAMTSSAETRRR
jgi:lipopolysaccharide export system protein LptC